MKTRTLLRCAPVHFGLVAVLIGLLLGVLACPSYALASPPSALHTPPSAVNTPPSALNTPPSAPLVSQREANPGHTAWMLVASAIRKVERPNDLQVTDVRFKSESGSMIAAWHCPISTSRATILLVHSLHDDRTSLVERAKLFTNAGYSVLMIDLQARGESSG